MAQNPTIGAVVEEKHYLLPIPVTELDANKLLEQTPDGKLSNYMKRRSFIRNISSLGLASVAVGTSFAAETPQSNSLPGKSKIPVYDGWDVIVVGGGPSGCAAATAAAREGAKLVNGRNWEP